MPREDMTIGLTAEQIQQARTRLAEQVFDAIDVYAAALAGDEGVSAGRLRAARHVLEQSGIITKAGKEEIHEMVLRAVALAKQYGYLENVEEMAARRAREAAAGGVDNPA